MTVQSIIFKKQYWSSSKAKKWLKDHNFKYGKEHKTENTLRYRQYPPHKNEKYRTINPGHYKSIYLTVPIKH